MSETKQVKDLMDAAPFSGAHTAPCPHCGKELLTNAGKWYLDERPELEELPDMCDCPAAVAERLKKSEDAERNRKARETAAWKSRFDELREDAGIHESWCSRRLRDWTQNTECRKTAWNAVKTAGLAIRGKVTAPGTKRGICIAGGVGAGKTFLLSCFAVDLLRCDVPILWCSVPEFLAEWSGSFKRSDVSERDVMRKYTSPRVLFIDDIGKERPTDKGCAKLYELINFWYDAEKPVMLSTNYSLRELQERLTPRPDSGGYADDTTAIAICDRLRAMCEFVHLDGRSMRG